MCALAVGCEPAAHIEAGFAAGNDQENTRASDSAHHLRGTVGGQFARWKTPGDCEPDRNSRIQVTSGNVSDGEGHGQHRQSERQRDACETDTEAGETAGQYTFSVGRPGTRTTDVGDARVRHHFVQPWQIFVDQLLDCGEGRFQFL